MSEKYLRAIVLVVATLFAASIAAACGDGANGSVSNTPTVPATTPPQVTETSLPPPTSTPDAAGVIRNPVRALPAFEVRRVDCPHYDWQVYENAEFSICFPREHYAHTWSSEGSPVRFSVRLIPGQAIAHTPWVMDVWMESAYDPPTTCVFQEEAVVPEAKTELMPYDIAGAAGVACRAQVADTVQFKGAVPTSSGALEFNINAKGEAQLNLAMRILGTVRLQETEATEG